MERLSATYRFCTKCKAALVQKKTHKKCLACGKEYFFNASATVTIIVTNKAGELLLTKRGSSPYKGWWELPGGFVEEGETLEEAVHRELKEETNLEIDKLSYVSSVAEDYEYNDVVVPVIACIFEGVAADENVVLAADDIVDCKFVAKKDIDISKIAFKKHRQFLHKYLKKA